MLKCECYTHENIEYGFLQSSSLNSIFFPLMDSLNVLISCCLLSSTVSSIKFPPHIIRSLYLELWMIQCSVLPPEIKVLVSRLFLDEWGKSWIIILLQSLVRLLEFLSNPTTFRLDFTDGWIIWIYNVL